MEDRRATPGPTGRLFSQGRGHGQPTLTQHGGPANGDLAPGNRRLNAAPGQGAERGCRRDGQRIFPRPLHDGPRQGVLGIRFHCRRQSKKVLRWDAVRGDRGHHRLSTGEGASLVEEDSGDLPHALQGEAILDQDALPGRNLG